MKLLCHGMQILLLLASPILALLTPILETWQICRH